MPFKNQIDRPDVDSSLRCSVMAVVDVNAAIVGPTR